MCDEPTPKLRSVSRWLARMDAAGEVDWDGVAWIDDVLGPDAREWTYTNRQARCCCRSRTRTRS